MKIELCRWARRAGACVLWAWAWQAAPAEVTTRADGAEPAPAARTVERALQHRGIEPDQALQEVRSHCAARVRPMPEVTSREDWVVAVEDRRRAVLDEVVFRGRARAWRDAPARVEWLDARPGGPGYSIRALRYEALPGLWIPALLYEPEGLAGRVPVVLNVNGHEAVGKAVEYKQVRCINQAKRGMLALNVEWIGMGQLKTEGFNHYRSNQLDLCGTSGVAVHYLALTRGLDLLLAHPHADPQRVAVTGLSGGGWQTIVLGGLDPRVTLANPVAGYSSFLTRIEHLEDMGDSEQTPADLAMVADYTHLTAMRAPRPTLLTYNAKDACCFRSDYALEPLLAAARPAYEIFGKPDHLRFHVNHDPGTHNFLLDNRQQLYRMLGDHFYPGDAAYPRDEIDVAAEIKSPEQLHVHLPASNLDFHRLAVQAMDGLPATRSDGPDEQRRRLANVLRHRPSALEATEIDRFEGDGGGMIARTWRLRLSEGWTLPATELVPAGGAAETVLLLADEGRAACGAEAASLVAAGKRVVAVDPLGCGEAAVPERPRHPDHPALFALLISAVGSRPLGIQTAQVGAVARWAAGGGAGRVSIHARGERTCMMALAAAALEPALVDRLDLTGGLGSLGEIITGNRAVTVAPELFCFGLLEVTDIDLLHRLADPCTIVNHPATPRSTP